MCTFATVKEKNTSPLSKNGEYYIERYGCPEIINSDQGVQYTSSKKWVELLEEKGIKISIYGKGR